MLAAVLLSALLAASAPQTINVWPGVAPGSESWTQHEQTITGTPIGTVVINVVTPTLTAYLPAPGKANGTAIIVAPGGAFVALAMDLEANDIARWLTDRGIAAFVLKYRTVEKRGQGIPADLDQDKASSYGIADMVQGLRDVRTRAASWGVNPNRIGVMGFSAGAMVASGALLQPDAGARPNFAVLVYGAPFGVQRTVPPGLPPTFMAWAKDDSLANYMSRFADALKAAGDPLDARVYATGGHGFGMKKHGTDSDRWVCDFSDWLQARGLTRRSH